MPSLQPLTSPLGVRLASHLLRRTSFKTFRDKIEIFAELTPEEAVNQLFSLDPLIREEPSDHETGEPWIINDAVDPITPDFRLRYFILGWWMNEALHDDSIGHRLEFFFHTIFPTERMIDNKFLFDHIALLRFYSQRGDFKTLAKKVVVDNSMLGFLDNDQNEVNNPNENFAREYLELHTILRGEEEGNGNFTNYTEEDIITAAKLLTGYRVDYDRQTIDPDTNINSGRTRFDLHDTTDKVFSDKFQNRVITGAVDEADMFRELDDFVEMIFDQRATAENMIRRMYKFFVKNEISDAVEADIIQPLADDLIADDYIIFNSLKRLLSSQHFYDLDDANNSDSIIGSLLKSPMDMFLQTMNTFFIFPVEPVDQTSMEQHYRGFYERHLLESLRSGGMEFYQPPTVAGYPSYHQEPSFSRLWFNTATIIGRFQVPDMFLESKYINGAGTLSGDTFAPFDIAMFVRDSGFISDPSNADILVQEFIQFTLPEESDENRFSYFRTIFLDELSPINWRFEWEDYIATGDASAVEIALQKLFRALLYSEEYQLM